MSDRVHQSRPMKMLDWLVVALVAFAVLFPFVAADELQKLNTALNGIAIFGCLLLLVWMWFGDGAHSRIWSWLPPFWPWGRTLRSANSRWGLVILLIAGTISAMIAEKFSK